MAMFRINVKKRARILTRAEVKRVLKVCTITREPLRNQLLILLTHGLGLRVTELATVTIRDVMHASGRIRAELTLRAEITKNARVRNLPLSNDLLLRHLDLYLKYRLENDIGVLPAKSEDFRGLSPDLPLIFSSRGGGFALATKKRVLETGAYMEYKACDALEQLFRHLYKISGMKGASSHSGRRSYASRLVESGVDIEDVSRLLGHADLDYTLIYVSPSKESVREAYKFALTENSSNLV